MTSTQATKAPTASPNKVSENNLASKLNELKESNKSQTSSRPVSQPSSSGSEITRRVHNNIPAPVAKVESQNSEGTGGTLPSQPMKPSDVFKELEKLGKNKGTGNVATEMSVDGANLLAQMEVNQNSKYMVKEGGVIKGIITHDVGDGGLTVGYGYYIKGGLSNTEEIKRLKNEYGIIVEEGKMVDIDKVTKLYSDSLGTYESLAQDYIKSRGLKPKQHEFDALVIQCYNGAYYSVMDAFGDSSLNDAQALDKALETYKKLSGWDKFGNGWTKRLDNVIHLYRHNDYNKTY